MRGPRLSSRVAALMLVIVLYPLPTVVAWIGLLCLFAGMQRLIVTLYKPGAPKPPTQAV